MINPVLFFNSDLFIEVWYHYSVYCVKLGKREGEVSCLGKEDMMVCLGARIAGCSDWE